MKKLSKHPSNITKSAAAYLEDMKVSEKTKRDHEEVLFFFIESLCSDPSAVSETEEGEFLHSSNWDDYYGGIISNFIDYWLPRKVLDDNVQLNAPGV